jgi:hypothetical protein
MVRPASKRVPVPSEPAGRHAPICELSLGKARGSASVFSLPRGDPPGRGGRGSAGRASPCQGEGRGFESRRPLGGAKRRRAADLPVTVAVLRAPQGWQGPNAGGVAEWLRQGPAKPCTRVRFPPPPRAISSVGERYLDTVEATGSIPVSPTTAMQVREGFGGFSGAIFDLWGSAGAKRGATVTRFELPCCRRRWRSWSRHP